MSEDYLIDFCSPTLAGIKTASLMSIRYDSVEDAKTDIRDMNALFVKKGLRAVPLKFKANRALIYVYRPGFLKKDLLNPKARESLSELGYPCDKLEACVAMLSLRVKKSVDFPHEIGFFLGYPPGDVLGFIKKEGKEYKCLGMWKVYDDEEYAKKKFTEYDRCRNCYRTFWKNGMKINELTVATAV